ncbi:hypothetical protein DL765_004674 [Monosporascus sp. GIB2]|nr:hypothetical protein DL765_004674 [Monosporascus sp. GIB2]
MRSQYPAWKVNSLTDIQCYPWQLGSDYGTGSGLKTVPPKVRIRRDLKGIATEALSRRNPSTVSSIGMALATSSPHAADLGRASFPSIVSSIARRFTDNSAGFAKAFVTSALGKIQNGEVIIEDVASDQVMVRNRDYMTDMKTSMSSFVSTIIGWTRASNRISISLGNVKAHYDISNEIFTSFLSSDMTYSCPIWLPHDNPRRDTDTLELAQFRKLHEIVKEAKIKPTDHVLEIGTGWGSFAIEAVKLTGCRVTSLTLSVEQKLEAEERIAAAGLEKNITVLLKDYRELLEYSKPFDKVVSIEMIEHVGKDHLPAYFRTVDRLLKRNGGIAVFQSSTMPETTKMIEAAHEGSNGTLIPDRLLNIGRHYSRCLREWRDKFAANFESRIVPALRKKNPGLTEAAIGVFKRKWMVSIPNRVVSLTITSSNELDVQFYFSFCEAGFKSKTLGVAMVTFAREGALETLE